MAVAQLPLKNTAGAPATITLTLGVAPPNSAGLIPKPLWTVLPTGIASVLPASDGMSCDVQAIAPGACTVTVSATPAPQETPPLPPISTTQQVQVLNPPPVINPVTVPAATQTLPYNVTLGVNAGTGTGPFAWALASGTLPAGLSLSAAGVISGTPTGSGLSTFTVQVTDSTGSIATQALSIAVTPVATGLTIAVGPVH